MSQLTKIAKHLRRNTEFPGISIAKLSSLTKVDRENVYRRVWDLRNVEGKTIYTNYRNVSGKRQAFYRLAA